MTNTQNPPNENSYQPGHPLSISQQCRTRSDQGCNTIFQSFQTERPEQTV